MKTTAVGDTQSNKIDKRLLQSNVIFLLSLHCQVLSFLPCSCLRPAFSKSCLDSLCLLEILFCGLDLLACPSFALDGFGYLGTVATPCREVSQPGLCVGVRVVDSHVMTVDVHTPGGKDSRKSVVFQGNREVG